MKRKGYNLTLYLLLTSETENLILTTALTSGVHSCKQ